MSPNTLPVYVEAYRTKPAYVEAYQLTEQMILDHILDETPLPPGIRLGAANYHPQNRTVSMWLAYTSRDRVRVEAGDWVIKKTDGTFSVCEDKTFKDCYEVLPPMKTFTLDLSDGNLRVYVVVRFHKGSDTMVVDVVQVDKL